MGNIEIVKRFTELLESKDLDPMDELISENFIEKGNWLTSGNNK